MKYENWQEIVLMIKDKFEILDEGTDTDNDYSEVQYIEFKKGNDKFRLELIIKPKVISKQTIYSKRIGSDTQEKFIYDDKEKVYLIKAFKYNTTIDKWEGFNSSSML